MAHDHVSLASFSTTCNHHLCTLPGWATTLGGQLRPHFRIHLRLPFIVRVVTFRVVRSLRQATKNIIDMGVPGCSVGHAHGSHHTFLRDPDL